MDILAIIATKVVTTVGIASYTSGLQKWNGAAETLNKNPTAINNKLISMYEDSYQYNKLDKSSKPSRLRFKYSFQVSTINLNYLRILNIIFD